jgi:adenylate cyclase class 2
VAIEIEKKYRVSKARLDDLLQRLHGVGAEWRKEEFEENTLYEGHSLDSNRCVLRLRRVGDAATLTYKERLPIQSDAKHQREEETRVESVEAMRAILEAIGFRARLVYEKRRHTWTLGETEIVIDELPFGLFVEIEGSESGIAATERSLGMEEFPAEAATYPQLTRKLGKLVGDVIQARFE